MARPSRGFDYGSRRAPKAPPEPKKTWDSSTLFAARRSLLAALRRSAGELVALDVIMARAGMDATNQNARVDAICELCRMEELGQVMDGWIGTGPHRKMAWKVEAPPDQPG